MTDEAMAANARVGDLEIGFSRVPIVRIDPTRLLVCPVDRRVSEIAAALDQRLIALVPCLPAELLSEPQNDFASETRAKLVTAVADSRPSNSSVVDAALVAMQLFADSLPDCVIELRKGACETADLPGAPAARLFVFPADVHALAIDGGVLDETTCATRWQKKRWQANLIRVQDLPRRFDVENGRWPQDDYSRYEEMDPVKEAVGKALGLDKTSEAILRERAYGRAIGEAVGKEQRHGWLATDLKLEHFLRLEGGRIAHVDHSDDVFLLRPPTTDEMASCICPLYQQMDFVQWQAFREGYVASGGATAIDVLLAIEGRTVLGIMASYCGRSASRQRASGNYDEALRFCSIIDEAAASNPGEADSGTLRAWAKLVRGDVLMAAQRLEEAGRSYVGAVAELLELQREGTEVDSMLFGGFANLALANHALGEHGEAMVNLKRAEEVARKIEKRDAERGGHLLRVISTYADEVKASR